MPTFNQPLGGNTSPRFSGPNTMMRGSPSENEMFGEKEAHGTPFRRAWEEGCLITDKVWQIGLRGSGYAPDDWNWAQNQGWTVIPAEQCWYRSLAPMMVDIRESVGDAPVYLSFDIDSLDPAFAPGTGTVEMGGLRPQHMAGTGNRSRLRRAEPRRR